MQINKHNAKSAAARSERGLHFFSSCKGILSDKSHYHGGSVYAIIMEGRFTDGSRFSDEDRFLQFLRSWLLPSESVSLLSRTVSQTMSRIGEKE